MSEISENNLEQSPEKILVSDISSRLEISRAAVYDKLKKLCIKPSIAKDGKKYITLDELKLLGELEVFLKEKRGDTKDFVKLCVEQSRIVLESTSSPGNTEPSITEEIAAQPPQERAELIEAVAPVKPTGQTTTPESQQQQITIVESDSDNVEILESASQQTLIEQLQVQKGLQTQALDIQEVSRRARDRAFARTVAEESLLLVYEATEDFTPEQKQQLEKHRALSHAAKTSRGAAHNVNDFLSQALSGLIVSPNSNSNPEPSPSGTSGNA